LLFCRAVQDSVADLLGFIDRSPTPYHAVAEAARRLAAAGYRELQDLDAWELAPGDRAYAIRGGGSLVALRMGAVSPVQAGFRVVGAHTDSPNLRLKPLADVGAHGYTQLAVEPYGGVLLHTWLDRDLSLAGQVTLREGERTRTLLVDFGRPLLRIPNLAIHLNREIATEGLKLNAQTHLAPVAGLTGAPGLLELVARELRARQLAQPAPEDVLAFDLMLYDPQPAAVSGLRGEFIQAPRLDNLASCHAAVSALLAAAGEPPPAHSSVVVLYDHEEVGSRTAYGAAGPLLGDALERAVSGWKGSEPQGLSRALARSLLVSADMAHAVHPNYADRHEPGHRPRLGGGPVIKQHAGRAYASDAVGVAEVAALCARLGITPQHFVTRSDLACGSTIGPIASARVGIRAVDVGSPMLSMHSCREMAGSHDVQPMLDLLRLFLAGA
jgi:aspartyl aminopeptidase